MKDCKKQELIMEKAKTLFFTEGNRDASTQEIADFVGVNRTLVNYYFGSKKKLFDWCLYQIRSEFQTELRSIIGKKVSIKERIALIIDMLNKTIGQYPYFNIYLIYDINKSKKSKKDYRFDMPELEIFFNDLKNEWGNDSLKHIDYWQFYIHIFALTSYPILMRPYYEKVLKLSSKDMDKLFEQRKESIIQLLLSSSFKNIQ